MLFICCLVAVAQCTSECLSSIRSVSLLYEAALWDNIEQMSVSTKVSASIKYYKHLTRCVEKRGRADVPEISCLGVNAHASVHLCE